MSDAEQWVLKLVLLGDHAVGKTSLISQYIDKSFEEDYRPTIGVNIIKKAVRLEQINTDVNLILWDIAWHSKYEKYRKFYFEGCTGALLVYDITRKPTFERIKSKWLVDFKNHVGKRKTSHILIGNKIDLPDDRVIGKEDGKNNHDNCVDQYTRHHRLPNRPYHPRNQDIVQFPDQPGLYLLLCNYVAKYQDK